MAIPNNLGQKIITQANKTFASKFHQSQSGDYFNNQQNPIIQNMASLKHYIGGRQGQSAMRYFKVREQAELEAKKHIEKLNEVMRQRQVREKKMEEILKDNSLERQFKLEKILQKRNTIREKFQKQVKDQEVRSMKLYSTSLKQLEERKNHMSFLQNSTTNKSFFNNAQDSSRMSIRRHQTSIMSQRSRYRDTNEDDHHLKLQLQSIDDKLKKGLERSQIFKQQISSKASQQFQKVQSLNVRGLQEEQKSQKWSSYLMKRQTLESKLEAQRKVMNERQQYQSQKNYEKLQKTQELKKELQKSSDFRFKQQQQRFLSSEKQIKQNQEKLRLEKLKREELWHLKRQDQIDNLQEQKLLREQEKQKLQQKHEWMKFQSQNVKEIQKVSDQSKIMIEMQRREYMDKKSGKGLSTFEQMKFKYLADAALTPDIKKFAIKPNKPNEGNN
eukprot:403334656